MQRGESLRATWFENGASPEDRASEAWTLLLGLFDRLTAEFRKVLNAPRDQDLRQFTEEFLRGERSLPGVDPEMVRIRQQEVLRYLRAMCLLNVAYKPLVPDTVLVNEGRQCWGDLLPPRPVRALVRLGYGMGTALRDLRG